MASHTLPQDVLLRAVQPYRGRPINLGTPRGQSGKEMVTTFHLDHTQRRDEIYFFGSLISALRRCYRIHPRVPQAEASLVASNSITFAEYTEQHVITPILALFDQTRQHYTPTLRSNRIEILNGQAVIYTLHTDGPTEASLPLLVFTVPGHLEIKEWEMDSISSSSAARVYAILTEIASTPTIHRETVVTDLATFISLQSIDAQNPTRFRCEIWPKLPRDYPALVGVAAFLPYHRYLDENVNKRILTSGAINNPSLPLPSEESVMERSSTQCFDLYTLLNSREHALQYFRWKERAAERALLRPIEVGNILSAATSEFKKRYIQGKVGKPYEPIPEDTLQHFKMNQRPQPLIQSVLEQSERFSVRVDRILKAADKGSKLGTTVVCSVVSIESHAHRSSPASQQLCLKVFDDRLTPLDPPNEELDPKYWFDGYSTAQDLVMAEDSVYRSLIDVQGSLVPWYLGAHVFTFPDGQELLGILMEFTPGTSLDNDLGKEMLRGASEDVQIQFIKSARHAVKVLQSLDISQLDWYAGQIMVVPAPSSGPPSVNSYYHAAFIDFSACSLTNSAYNGHRDDDYGAVQEILVDPDEGVGLRKELVRKWFGKRESWDYFLTDHTKE